MWCIIIFIISLVLMTDSMLLIPLHTQQKYNNMNGRKKRNTSSLYVRKINTNNNGSSSAQRQRRRPPRPQRRVKTGLSNICPPLGGPVGAPELPVLTTKDPRIIERWIDEHVGSSNEYSILGFDSETIAKPPWKPERQSLPNGPATVQLSTTTSCIIIQLALCGDGSASFAPKILQSVINDPKIIKVGVGIDDDALDLYRWSQEDNDQQLIYNMKSRLDLGCLLNSKSNRRAGLRELAEKTIGVDLIKSKKLAMSNWGKRDLTMNEISYAARDAWVAVAIIDALQKHNNVFNPESLMAKEFMANQKCMDVMDDRAKRRKRAKLELKDIQQRASSEDMKDVEERKEELYKIMDKYRAEQPPNFSEDNLIIPQF